MSDKFDISFVLGTKGRAGLLDKMLSSLQRAIGGLSYEIIVIDGNSEDNTLEILKKHKISKVYIESKCLGDGYHSWAEIYNFGFLKAQGKWTMYLSDDIEFNEGCFDRALRVLEKQDDSIAGGVFYYRNIRANPGWKTFGVDYTLGQKLLLNYGLIRLDFLRQVGGLDTSYKFYCADGDLCLKLYDIGKDFIPLPECLVTHTNGFGSWKKKHCGYARADIEKYKKKWAKLSYPISPKRILLDGTTCKG